ncbi:TPA: hypothetical protein N0F65_000123 [Lagenidium giganteum]|uniref:Centrosomin N-terminal motif 1 domain-containing protein n=1 Tax=Lagenidium giganteum TaxID=4803 RepID=A0AAV2YYA0_9STRA|nr:TPA: hypothetical protein N0F65_000123 [Lagenidium giganteum]
MQSPFDATSPSMSPGSGQATSKMLLREQNEERDRLLTENFNMKMRINYLEEKLNQLNQGTPFGTEDQEQEIFHLRAAIKEKEAILHDRNAALERAGQVLADMHRQLLEARAKLATMSETQLDRAVVDELKQELKRMQEEHAKYRERCRDLENELVAQQDSAASKEAMIQDIQDRYERANKESAQLKQAATQFESFKTQAVMEMKRLESAARLQAQEADGWRERCEKSMHEKDALEARFQDRMKRAEANWMEQFDKAQRECERYRSELTRVMSDHERERFEKDRAAMEASSAKMDQTKLQTDVERLSSELERVVGEAEALRLQNVKLTATCDHQNETIEQLRNIEREAFELRKTTTEQSITNNSLQAKLRNLEEETERFRNQAKSMMSQSMRVSDDRLSKLEKEKLAAEEENQRLRHEGARLQNDLIVLERKYSACHEELIEESARLKEFRERLADCESTLFRKSAMVDQLQGQLAEVTNSTLSETTRLRREADQSTRAMEEIDKLKAKLNHEQRQSSELKFQLDQLGGEKAAVEEELAQGKSELLQMMGGLDLRALGSDAVSRSITRLVREAINELKMKLQAHTTELETQWQQQVSLLEAQITRLETRLHACQSELGGLKLASGRSQQSIQEIERNWSIRYEKMRMQLDNDLRVAEQALRDERTKSAKAESKLTQAMIELEALTHAKNGSMAELEKDYREVQESNRLLFSEIQERRRSAEKARKQYMKAVAENKDLIAAVDYYRSLIVDQEKEIDYYKGCMNKYTEKLGKRNSLAEVKQKMLEQVEQTQYMINATYKRWKESPFGSSMNGSASNVDASMIVQLDEYIGKMEVLTDQWKELVHQCQELHARYSEAWAASAHTTNGRERPGWADLVERKCDRLIADAKQQSEVLRGVTEDVLHLLTEERSRVRRKQQHQQQSDKDNRVARHPSSSRSSFDNIKALNRDTYRTMPDESFPLHRIGEELKEIERRMKASQQE